MGRYPDRFYRTQRYFQRQHVAARARYAGKWITRFARVGAGVGAVAAAGVANLFTRVPRLDTMPRMIGYKRRNGGDYVGGPVTAGDSAQGGTAMQKVSYKYTSGGKRVGKTRRLLKHLSAHVCPLVERWGVSHTTAPADTIAAALASMRGAIFMSSGVLTGDTTFGYPVFLFDLTGVYNWQANVGTPRYPVVAHRLKQTVAGDMFYDLIPGANAADNAQDSYSWLTERLTKGTGVIKAGESVVIDGYKLDLTMFGAAKLPSEIYVEMWRFSDEKLCPKDLTGSSVIAVPGSEYHTPDQLRMNEFWRQRLGKMVGKADHVPYGNDKVADGVEIRRIGHFVFNPQNSTEALAGAGHQKNFHYFHKWNKNFKYDYCNTESTAVIPGDVDNPDFFVAESGAASCMCFPKPSSRWFLVVRGDVQIQNQTSAGSTNPDLFPSFDIVLRRYRRLVKD